MKTMLSNYAGKARDIRSYLAAQFPRNVILISAYKQRKTASAKAASGKIGNKVVVSILPDDVA